MSFFAVNGDRVLAIRQPDLTQDQRTLTLLRADGSEERELVSGGDMYGAGWVSDRIVWLNDIAGLSLIDVLDGRTAHLADQVDTGLKPWSLNGHLYFGIDDPDGRIMLVQVNA